jgi:hypothetical protein
MDTHHLNGSIGDHAARYLAAGLSVLPAVRSGEEKRVALASWKPYQSRLPDGDEIREWFDGNRGAVSIVCGRVSGNLEMIDFDLMGEAYGAWVAAVEAAAPGLVSRLVVESTPSGGRHVVYRCLTPVSGNLKLAQRRIEADGPEPVYVGTKACTPRLDAAGSWHIVVTMVETRGEGGLFLCAPSDGYVLLQGDLSKPPVITADERDVLLGCAWALDEMPKQVLGRAEPASREPSPAALAPAAAGQRPGEDFNARGDVREVLHRHGWSLARAGENEHWRRPGKAAGTSATLKDRVLYVFSSNAAPFDPNTAYSPFAVYAMLEHGGDFRRAASALAALGYGTPAPAAPGVDLSGFLKTATADQAAPERGMRKVGDLWRSFPRLRPPVIHGLLREGETMNVIAAPKTGKSWLTIDLALAVATGRMWLDRYETVRGDVLIVDNELHPETSAHRIPKVAEARGIDQDEIADTVWVDNLRGGLRSLLDLGPYFAAIEPGRFKVIVLDAFYRFMPVGSDENDNGTMANIYNVLDAYADRLRCSFVLIHHSTKGSQSGKSVTDVGAGAGAQSRATDTHLVLRPHEENGVVVLDAAVRSWQPIDPVCLRWSFPLWNADPMLDATQLKHEGPRRKREPKQAGQDWTPATLVDQFIQGETHKAEVLARAVEAGLTKTRAEDLYQAAARQGLFLKRPVKGNHEPQTIYPAGASR